MQWHFNDVGVNFLKNASKTCQVSSQVQCKKHFVTWMHKNERDGSDSFSTELFKYCSDKRHKN